MALAALRANFVDDIELAALGAESAVGMLKLAVDQGIAGGAIYDFLIARTAVGAGVNTLLTMNGRHFERFDLPLQVVVPAP